MFHRNTQFSLILHRFVRGTGMPFSHISSRRSDYFCSVNVRRERDLQQNKNIKRAVTTVVLVQTVNTWTSSCTLHCIATHTRCTVRYRAQQSNSAVARYAPGIIPSCVANMLRVVCRRGFGQVLTWFVSCARMSTARMQLFASPYFQALETLQGQIG